MIRQKMFLMAEGIVARGLGVSHAAKETSSDPEYENAAVTNTEHTPLNPLANAPGTYQCFAPIYCEYSPLLGPPPQMQTTAMIKKMETTMSLSHEVQNSTSA